ncbi:MAG: RagB/SusD family nutrient uptake outer membrane protein [Draconibacterium sp.]|nr:RagB/SusD family nutrient uptake outer membrane protein [Draconibacterium sp.]
MKKRIIYISIALVFIGLVSCQDFLSEVPKTQASPENFYKTEGQAETAVIGVYNALQRDGVYGRRQYFITTDIVRTAPWNTQGGMGTYSMSADNTQVVLRIWGDHYKGINDANAAIAHIPNIEMDEERKNTLIAEAKFIRSLLYFNLVRYFGDIPYLDSETSSLEGLEVERTPAETIYNNIITDLEFGIANLNEKDKTVAGRVTVGAAKTLLSKVYLTRASMSQRDGTGDAQSDFQNAAQLAKEVIQTGEYFLNDYFPDAFIVENKNSDEIIFDVQFKRGGLGEGNLIGMDMGLMGPKQYGGSWGNVHSTEYYSTIYEPTDKVRRDWTTPHIRVVGPGKIKKYPVNASWQPWKIGKFRRYPVRSSDFVWDDWDIHWPVFRYSEILLIYAEALNEVNNGPTQEVFDALNQLRTRARNVNTGDIHDDIYPRNLTYDETILPDISSIDYPDYASIKQYIFFERARELGGEAKRWFDLVRWGKLVEQIKFLKDYVPPGRKRPEGKNWNITADNIKDFHMLMPIPGAEIQSNQLLTQNPGY